MRNEFTPYAQAMADRHLKSFLKHGAKLAALGWLRESQQKRFEILAEVGAMRDSRLLDVGCGFGDFLAFLEERGLVPATYTGVDVVPQFIDEAKRRYPASTFFIADVL